MKGLVLLVVVVFGAIGKDNTTNPTRQGRRYLTLNRFTSAAAADGRRN